MKLRLDDVIESAAFELIGLHPDDQRVCIAAACNTLAEYLHEQRPWLTDAQIERACCGLARRVRARLREIEAQAAGQTVH